MWKAPSGRRRPSWDIDRINSYNLHIILEKSMCSKRQRQARLQQLFIHSDPLWVSLGSGYVNFSEGPTRSRIPKEPNFVLRCELMMINDVTHVTFICLKRTVIGTAWKSRPRSCMNPRCSSPRNQKLQQSFREINTKATWPTWNLALEKPRSSTFLLCL